VYVNPSAEACPDFQNGYCPNGKACKLKHIDKIWPRKEKEIEMEKVKDEQECDNSEKRWREDDGEVKEEMSKRRKGESGLLAKQIRPDFSAFFGHYKDSTNTTITTKTYTNTTTNTDLTM
jgi:hypothetical protein